VSRIEVEATAERLTPIHRLVRRRIHRLAGKRTDEPLAPDDWEAFFRHHVSARAAIPVLSALPRSPRCRICGAPFAGFASRVLGPLGYRPSRKNPHFCATCIEFAPPGGMTTTIGVLFADVRGFTGLAERTSPHDLSVLLRRFYALAEEALFPEALIDKLIGDAVMALYIPLLAGLLDPQRTMLSQARKLLTGLGHGSAGGPVLEVGVGIDYGQAFVGNIGERWLFDFTAVGDVVNTASRLEGAAAGGEILVSGRLARQVRGLRAEEVHLPAKGDARPLTAYRVLGVGAEMTQESGMDGSAGVPHR
jgi:adenylate cyclase